MELLKREKCFYLNNAGNYFNFSEESKKRNLVEKIEEILAAENIKYFSNYQHQTDSIQMVKDVLLKVEELKNTDKSKKG